MSTYVIGDVQGCFRELQQLLVHIHFNENTDELWFAGDLINRGPNNLETLEFVMSLPKVKTVLGNHDLHFLAIAAGVQKTSKSDTLNDLLQSEKLPAITEWMRYLPLTHFDEKFDCFLVHAGLPPIWKIQDAICYATEVETILQSNDHKEFFAQMYGNLPNTWHEGVENWDRLRLITNYLTRLRYCTVDGMMELTHKADIQPDGYAPWFSFRRPDSATILFGHWAAIEGITHQRNMIAVDTGCVWGRRLTAYRLDDQQLFSVPAFRSAMSS